MKFSEFEKIVEESYNDLPEEFRKVLEDNGIVLIPRYRVPKQARVRGILFGMFFGVPLGNPLEFSFEPTRIELYKDSFEECFSDPAEIKRQVKITVVHEVAHYFGFSEKQLRKMGLG